MIDFESIKLKIYFCRN